LRIDYGARSDQGMVRTSNEDSYIANIQSRIFLVADGMGGHAAGEIASHIAASTIDELVSGRSSDSNMEELLQAAAKEANKRVYETQKLKSEYRGMGSTLTVLTLLDDHYYVAQVGDSRAYLFRDKKLQQLTRDHSLVWPLYESGILTKDDISRHPQKNLITRSIGTHFEVEVDLQKGTVHEGDIFLLCSDGLTDVLLDHDILQVFLNAGPDPREISELFIRAANSGGGPDNVTAVVVCLIP
jgi:serine/threonine protein phosphatase PrpC